MKKIVKNFKFIKHPIFLFCEGETEKLYFQCLRSQYRIPMDMHVIGDVNISNISKQIIKISNYLKKDKGFDKRDINKYQLKIFYLVDIDTIKDRKEVDFIKQKFEEEGITILFSNKNIELFILEHYDYYNKESGNYITEIKKHVSDYKKGEGLRTRLMFDEIIGKNIEILRDNFKLLQDFHKSNGRIHIYDMNPYSEVIDLIEYILKISNNN